MTHLVNKEAPEPRGNGRIRRTLPALGLIAAAISGYASQPGGPETAPAPERLAPVVTVPMIVRDATLLHFARAQGVGDALRETVGPLPAPLDRSLQDTAALVEAGRTDLTAYRIDMAYSAGYLDGVEGGWGPERLQGYLNAAFRTEIALFELADQAIVRWAGPLGLEGGRALVTGTMALTVASGPLEPVWSGPISAGSDRGAAFLEVSIAVRGLLGELEEAASQPPPPTGTVTAAREGGEPAEPRSGLYEEPQPEMEI